MKIPRQWLLMMRPQKGRPTRLQQKQQQMARLQQLEPKEKNSLSGSSVGTISVRLSSAHRTGWECLVMCPLGHYTIEALHQGTHVCPPPCAQMAGHKAILWQPHLVDRAKGPCPL